MPKMKTHKGAKRRFQVTGSGKLMHLKQGKSHLRRKKSGRTKSDYGQKFETNQSDLERLKRMLPYAGIS